MTIIAFNTRYMKLNMSYDMEHILTDAQGREVWLDSNGDFWRFSVDGTDLEILRNRLLKVAPNGDVTLEQNEELTAAKRAARWVKT